MENKVRPTLKDVAAKSGYALRTVKKVMGGKERVGEKTRKKVLAAAAELNYQRNNFASAFAKNRDVTIAIVYTENSKAYFPEVEKGFLRGAEEWRDFGLAVKFYKLHDKNAESQIQVLEQIAEDDSIDGVVMQPMSMTKLDPYIEKLLAAGKPSVLFGADAPQSKRLCYIGPDANKSGRIGAQVLANYIGKKGKVFIVSQVNEHMQTVDRTKGFQKKISESYPDIETYSLNVTENPKLYYEMIKTIVTSEDVQGLFCTDANGYIAGQVLKDLGMKGPVVVGFDLSPMATGLMRDGYMHIIIEQKPDYFSFLALKVLANYIYFEERPELDVIQTGLSILTSECV